MHMRAHIEGMEAGAVAWGAGLTLRMVQVLFRCGAARLARSPPRGNIRERVLVGRMTMAIDATHVVAATVEEFWRFTDDPEAQVRFDDRIQSITVTEGTYGEPGMVAAVAAQGPLGIDTAVLRLVAVDRPRSYVTEAITDDVTSTSTVTVREVQDGLEVTARIEVATRELNPLERASLWVMKHRLRKEAVAEHGRAIDALAAFVDARREGRA